VLELQGVDKHTIRNHSKNCAPYHLPNLDPTIIMSTWIPPFDYPCQVCQKINDANQMLFCNNCNGGYHLFCLKLELIQVPVGIWYCSSCSPTTTWFLFIPCHTFLGSGLGRIHENFIATSSCALYIYVCACILFWLISFYLWLVLVFLFSIVYYGFTPLQHCMSQHYTSRQLEFLILKFSIFLIRKRLQVGLGQEVGWWLKILYALKYGSRGLCWG